MGMEKISSFISKKVISLEEGNLLGYVINVVFDEDLKIFEGLIVVDEESENTFFLNKKGVVSSGDDCIMIDSSAKLQFYISSLSNNPINKIVYDGFGNMLGKVIEVEVQGKQVKKIITSKCEFPPKYVRKMGENFIIYGVGKKQKNIKTFKSSIGEIAKENNLPLSYVMVQEQAENKQPESPSRLFANASSLIGKMVTNEILGLNNELIANKFDVIDKNIINKAKNHNKLNLLAYYSK